MATGSTTGRVADILAGWRSQDVEFVRFELPDMHGISRSKLIPIAKCGGYAEDGLNMYGGAAVLDTRSDVVPGTLYNEEIGYGDHRLVPDPDTALVLPWAPGHARFICDSVWDDGRPLVANPRHVFRRVLERCRSLGYEPLIGYEPEFYLLDAETRAPLFSGYQIFNTVRNLYTPFVEEVVRYLNGAGIDVITANCEYAGSQWEINFSPGRGLDGPDRAFTFKNAVKEIAHANGYIATFMSKPFSGSSGSGCHTHVSLLDEGGENVFCDETDPQRISTVCRQFIAGQLRYARGIDALLAPTLNCFKRRRPHTFSPVNISWGPEDRSAMIRIKGGPVRSRHIENRAPAAMANPYLIGAAILGAGILGIEEALELEPPARAPAEQDHSKPPLPLSLRDSLAALESDEQLSTLLGEEFISIYATVRRHELQRFDDHVTDWELDEYLEIH